MNEYDHEDAFKDASRCAGRLTNLSEAIKWASSKELASAIIYDSQKKYENLFTAFIEGVEWGRNNPRKP